MTGGSSSLASYQYGAGSNRLVQINNQSVGTDESGNLTSDRDNHQFSYDEQSRLRRVVVDGEIRAQYRYNGLGQRTQKTTLQGVTTFLYGLHGELLGETLFDNQGNKLTSQFYFWLDRIPLGGTTINYDATGTAASSSLFYLHSDHLNTPRIATNASQGQVWEWKSDAFGVGEPSGSLTLNLRFPGQYFDFETGFQYNYFRNYDPKTGRYRESDPIGLKADLNTYSYASGNPLKYIDPLGLESIFEWSSIAEIEAKNSALPGMHNGPQDAYRHCVASCMIASSNRGETVSRLAGWANEMSNFGQNPSERAMDDFNNQVGICAAKGSSSPENCPKSCMTLLNNGMLTTEASSEGAYY
ncbi:RHS repeat domain-containing protein [Pseudomonas fluorescens]|uniref:RHS repeat domain-containing protein n=1 Tax=Pseudomonas fluorescens TaxID=294 RepID=UPI00333A6BBE